MRHQNMRLRYGQERLCRFALQIPNHAPGHVLDIDSALAQIRIVDLAQRVGVTLRYFLKNIFNVAAVGFEFAKHFVDQRPIFHDQQMRIENARILGPDRLCDALLHLENLPARLHERGLETRNLLRDPGPVRSRNARRRPLRRARRACDHARCPGATPTPWKRISCSARSLLISLGE